HIAIFLHALTTGAHDAPHAVLAIMLRLGMNREWHADLLGCGVNWIEHAVSQVYAVNIGWQHGAHNRALLAEIFQLLYGCGRILDRNQPDALQPFWIGCEVVFNEPAVYGVTDRRGNRLVGHAVD